MLSKIHLTKVFYLSSLIMYLFLTEINRWKVTLTWCSVQFSRSVVSDSMRPHEPQPTRPSCPSPTPEVHPNPCPLCRWCHPTISSSVAPLLFLPSIFPVLFKWVSSLHQVAKVLEFQLQHQSIQWIFRTDLL